MRHTAFIITSQAAVCGKPGKGAFNDPPLLLQDKTALLFIFDHHFESQATPLLAPLNGSGFVARIDPTQRVPGDAVSW